MLKIVELLTADADTNTTYEYPSTSGKSQSVSWQMSNASLSVYTGFSLIATEHGDGLK